MASAKIATLLIRVSLPISHLPFTPPTRPETVAKPISAQIKNQAKHGVSIPVLLTNTQYTNSENPLTITVHLLLLLALLPLAGSVTALQILQRDSTSASGIDKVPTTTDFPPPATTDSSSNISIAYTNYIVQCGTSLQDEIQAALGEYEQKFNKPSTDPNDPDFLSWAYANYTPYYVDYIACKDQEKIYQQMLATFIPEVPTSTSGAGVPATSMGSSVASSSATNGGSSAGSGARPSNGNPISYAHCCFVFMLAVLLTTQLLMG
ncbi:hypothetical protein B0H10DRAFT_2299387 [Mycena sp. CBHHK59/15]|nr:hypothetical protein B0H10DRAFT_2299387 [Mycena sp. CBHHK59/15]